MSTKANKSMVTPARSTDQPRLGNETALYALHVKLAGERYGEKLHTAADVLNNVYAILRRVNAMARWRNS